MSDQAYAAGYYKEWEARGLSPEQAEKLAQYMSPPNRARMARGQNVQQGAQAGAKALGYTPAAGGNKYGDPNSAYAKARAARAAEIAQERAFDAEQRAGTPTPASTPAPTPAPTPSWSVGPGRQAAQL